LVSLECFDASRNSLSTLPDSIGGWRAMQRLVLSENQLTSLPESLCRLITLTHCFLHGNRLTDLPANKDPAAFLHALQVLNWSDNAFPKGWKPPALYRKAQLPGRRSAT
jgi:Leucine-rich repeat (LRR) protein